MERVSAVMLDIGRAGIIRAIAEPFKRMNANIESHPVFRFRVRSTSRCTISTDSFFSKTEMP